MRSSMKTTPSPSKKPLLATKTGEPFQPVRLYFRIPGKMAVVKVFAGLRCFEEDDAGRSWNWLYQDEASALTFGRLSGEVPPDAHPLIIGRFRFPDKQAMVLELRSFERAIQAAKFFGPILGPKVVLVRARVINRWFEGAEAARGLERLDRLLDANVVRIDPKDAEDAFDRAMAGAVTRAEKERAMAAYAEERRRKDVPLVEDFPLAPEEETPEFRDLTMTLRLRALRASEHWKGNTHLTLADVIYDMVEKGNLGAAG